MAEHATARLSQPSGVPLRPGVPVSMKSWASKWERVGSGEPTGVDDGEPLVLKQREERGEARVEAEAGLQIEQARLRATLRSAEGEARAQRP